MVGSRTLVLDIEDHGMHAEIWEKKISGITRTGQVSAARNQLPDPLPEDGLWYRAALDALARQTDLSSCTEALVLIPSRNVFFRNISLPFSSPGKIAQVLPFELAPYLPADACVSDFIAQKIRFVNDQPLLLTASASEPLVEEIISCLQAYHIRPRIITPRGVALTTTFVQRSGQVLDRMFIHAGRTDITLTLMAGSRPVMVRTLAPSPLIQDTIAENMVRMATGFRQRSGLDTRFHVCLVSENDAVNPAQMTQKITQARSLQSFFHIDSVTVMDPDPDILGDLLLQKPANLLNFARTGLGPGAFFNKFRQELLATGIIGALAVILSVLSLYQDVHVLENQVSEVRRAGVEIYQQTFPQDRILAGHSPLLRMQANVKQALAQKGGTRLRDMADMPDLPAIDVLYELSARIPDKMTLQLSRLLLNNGQVTISGTTDGFNTVDRLKTALEGSDLFKTVTIHTADAARDGNQVIFQFRIEM
jgi:general secretion pathway protein L